MTEYLSRQSCHPGEEAQASFLSRSVDGGGDRLGAWAAWAVLWLQSSAPASGFSLPQDDICYPTMPSRKAAFSRGNQKSGEAQISRTSPDANTAPALR